MLNETICQNARLSRDARFDGKFFTAVLTTGIFCRPICPARAPKPENVRYYLSAEQAQQAGFRPCKRCFPELAPQSYLPTRIRNIVQTHDMMHGSISLTAKQHNISERQLQRLFVQHYGLPPSKFFHQKRLLLARKLLSTSLSITDVCFASGYNSIRRFNEAFKLAYLCTPSDMRKTNMPIESSNTVTIVLPYRPPFDWPLMLSFFRNRQIDNMEHVTEHSYKRTIALGRSIGWLEVSHHPTKPALQLTVKLSDYSELNQVITRVRTMFDLDADMALIHQHLADHPILAGVIAQYPGLRLPGCWDIFEFSIRAILGQQVSVKAATTMAKRITEKYGQNITAAEHNIGRIFPTAQALHTVDYDGIGLTTSRIATLNTWVAFFIHNPQIFNQYQSLAELEQQLTSLKGIGPWTVNYLAMRGLSDPDAFPSADLGIIKALTVDDEKPKNNDILALAEQWRPWRAYAAIYLWHSLPH